MAYSPPSDDEVLRIVRDAKVVAVVGMKDEASPGAPAFTVPAVMKARGIEIIPVNPTITSALGVPALANVGALDRSVDVLQVFRRSDAVGPVADDVLAMPPHLFPKVVWLQSGIINEDAAERLAARGISVVMDRCFAVEMARARCAMAR